MTKKEIFMFYIPNSMDVHTKEEEMFWDEKIQDNVRKQTGKHYADATWYPVSLVEQIYQSGLVEEEPTYELLLKERIWSSIMGDTVTSISLNKHQYEVVIEQLKYKLVED